MRGFALGSVLALVMLAVSASAWADTDIQGNATGLPNVDVRTGKLAPTAGQRADVRDLGAHVAWKEFGTPSTLVRQPVVDRDADRSAACGERAIADVHRPVPRCRAELGRERSAVDEDDCRAAATPSAE